MKKIINLFTLGVFLISNIMTPLTNFIYAEENETLDVFDDLAVVRDMGDAEDSDENIPETSPEDSVNDYDSEIGNETLEVFDDLAVVRDMGDAEDGDENIPETDPEKMDYSPTDETEKYTTLSVDESEKQGNNKLDTEQKTIDEEIDLNGDYPKYTIVDQRREESNNTKGWEEGIDFSRIYIDRPEGITQGPERIIIMDRNLGATNTDLQGSSSFGYKYQRGNNYGFENGCFSNNCKDNVSNSSLRVDIDGASYSRDMDHVGYVGKKFIKSESSTATGTSLQNKYDYWMDRNPVAHNGLWGGENDADYRNTRNNISWMYYDDGGDRTFRQGPCPEGWHVPSLGEWNQLFEYWAAEYNAEGGDVTLEPNSNKWYFFGNEQVNAFKDRFKLPLAGYRDSSGATLGGDYATAYYWTSSPERFRQYNYEAYAIKINTINYSTYIVDSVSSARADAYPIRCFRDTYEDIKHTITYKDGEDTLNLQPSSVSEGSSITNLPTPPNKIRQQFEGWYKDASFDHIWGISDIVNGNTTLYAKWKECAADEEYLEGGICGYPITYVNTLQAVNNNPSNYNATTPNISLVKLYKDEHTKFEGWYTDEEYQNKVQGVAIPQGSTGARTFYAKWSCKGGSTREGDECIFHGTTATLITGANLNMALKSLAKGSSVTDPSARDDLIKGFVWRDSLPNGVAKIKISTDEDSDVPVWAWLDTAGYGSGGIVYYTSEADRIYMNPDSSNMFEYMQGLTSLDLNKFDTSFVTTMSNMFAFSNNLISLDLSNFDTSNLSSASAMFNGCSSLTLLNLDNWDLSKPTYISGMFVNANNLKTLSLRNWTIPEEFSNMLGCRITNLCANLDWIDVSNWDLSKTKNISGLFGSSNAYEIRGLDTWNTTSNIENIANMFGYCYNLTGLNLDNWNLSSLSNVGGLYSSSTNLKTISMKNWILPETVNQRVGWSTSVYDINFNWIDVSGWDLSKTKRIQGVFAGNHAKEIRGLNTWDTSNIEDMYQLFQSCDNVTGLDVSNWNTSNVTNMKLMFHGDTNLERLDLSKWNTSNVKDMSFTFGYDHTLTGLDLSNWDTSNVEDMTSMFNHSINLTSLNLDNWDLSNSPVMTDMFKDANNLKELSLKNWKIPTSFNNILGGATNESSRNNLTAELDWIDVSNWDLSETEDLMGVFGDNKTKEIRGLGTWDTSNVTDMREMFAGTTRLTGLDLSNWDTSNVEDMTFMFAGANALRTIYASEKFVTTKVTDVVNSMFAFTDLVGGQGTAYEYEHAGTDYAKIDGGTSNPGYFTQAYSITYNLDGGELQHPKTAYSPISTFTLSKPTKEFYTFLGWTGNNGEEPEENVVIAKGTQGNLEFTANWAANKYQIIFDVDGGDAIDSIEVEYNSSLEGLQLPTPTKGGYKFVGWNGLPETMPAEDITIVASWEQVSQGSYSSGGGGSKVSPIDVVEKTVDDNTHKAADEKDESKTPDGKGGSSDSSDAASVEANYSQEFVEAYDFAKSNGITTQPSIQKAKMNSPLTRIAMAKMLSYYAMNVLGQEPDMSKTINFDDVSAKRDAEYDNGVTLAYQLGIMGINMKNNRFRPNDEVTRAEFVTALSRMIYGMRDGTGEMKYYEPHMARLYNEGIINETNPKMKEKRGYVMIMLMRTVK